MNSVKFQDIKLIYCISFFLSIAFLHIKDELSETEVTNNLIHNWTKYPEINLTKDVKDLYSENYKILKISQTMKRYTVLKNWKNQYC